MSGKRRLDPLTTTPGWVVKLKNRDAESEFGGGVLRRYGVVQDPGEARRREGKLSLDHRQVGAVGAIIGGKLS